MVNLYNVSSIYTDNNILLLDRLKRVIAVLAKQDPNFHTNFNEAGELAKLASIFITFERNQPESLRVLETLAIYSSPRFQRQKSLLRKIFETITLPISFLLSFVVGVFRIVKPLNFLRIYVANLLLFFHRGSMAYLQLAVVKASMKKYDEAIAYYLLAKRHGMGPVADPRIRTILLVRGFYPLISRMKSDEDWVDFAKVRVLLSEGRNQDCVALSKKLLPKTDRFSVRSYLYLYMGDAYMSMGERSLARECWQESVRFGTPSKKNEPFSTASFIAEARLLEAFESKELFAAGLHKIRTEKLSNYSNLTIAVFESQLGNIRDALLLLDSHFASEYPDVDALSYFGDSVIFDPRFDALLDTRLERRYELPDVRKKRKWSPIITGSPVVCWNRFKTIFLQDKENIDRLNDANVYLREGMIHLRRRELYMAWRRAGIAVERHPTNERLHLLNASIHIGLNRFAEAHHILDEVIELTSKSNSNHRNEALFMKGCVYLYSQSRLDEALDCFNKILQSDKNFYQCYREVIRIYLDKNDIEKAAQQLKSALELFSSDPKIAFMEFRVNLKRSQSHRKATNQAVDEATIKVLTDSLSRVLDLDGDITLFYYSRAGKNSMFFGLNADGTVMDGSRTTGASHMLLGYGRPFLDAEGKIDKRLRDDYCYGLSQWYPSLDPVPIMRSHAFYCGQFDVALEMDPYDYMSYYELAKKAKNEGNKSKAISYLKEALYRCPADENLLYHLAVIKAEENNNDPMVNFLISKLAKERPDYLEKNDVFIGKKVVELENL